MAELFVGPIVDKIINVGFDYLEKKVGWQTGMKKELERLRDNRHKIQAVVFAANQAQISDQNHPIKKWIWQLRDALDEVNDVLDEFEYMKHREQLTKNMEEKEKRIAFFNGSFLFGGASKIRKVGDALKIDPNLQSLEDVVQKLDKVSAGFSNFLHLLDIAKQEQQEQQREFSKARETGSMPTNYLIGRSEAKEVVMQSLSSSNEPRISWYKNISLLSIVGHGGMGKTTLLQHVYEDEITKELFNLKMWVCVSNNFDVKKVIEDMLESLKKQRPRLDSIEALQDSLRTEIESKKFLLVLDDIWEEEENREMSKWEKLLTPLAYGCFGSKIMITTRTDSIATKFSKFINQKPAKLTLKCLEKDQCLRLLNLHAFGVENPLDAPENLRAIAGEIVKKLLGSPLAAKVIGRILNEELDERRWRTVLESNLLGENSIHSILRLSYILLPNHLQNCFAFCCKFPQDYMFDKDDFVRMWIALGFIQPSQGMTMEDISGRYFDDLVRKSLFDKVGGHYKMHDLIHESASQFFAQVCIEVVDDERSSHDTSKPLRYLFVQTGSPDIINTIGQFKHLHSLFLFYKAYNNDILRALAEIFRASRSLRLLYVCAPYLTQIPEEIENLIHLRYLKIVGFNLTMLPKTLSNLYHLQYIIYDTPEDLEPQELDKQDPLFEIDSDRLRNLFVDDFLPSGINSLPNLRYMILPKRFSSLIRWTGKLKSRPEQVVSGYESIERMKNMNDLCILEMKCLEYVQDAEEARNAQLCEKKMLTDLTLRWNKAYGRNFHLDEIVLDNLQPPKCLRNLRIERYMGARSAIWMNNVNRISNLEKIELTNCLECETLPPFGQLPFLKSLILFYMPKVKWLESKFNGNDLYHPFPSLEVLHIEELEALEDWFEAGVAAEDGCLFPCLIELKLRWCWKLKELPSLPPKLKILSIESMDWTTLKFCSNSNPIPLESLAVSYCPIITYLPLADEIARLAALRSLTIKNCPKLISLGRYREVETTNNCHLMLSYLCISYPLVLLMEPLRSIAYLQKLSIEDNLWLDSFPNEAEQWFRNVSSSLCELQLLDLAYLESLPFYLESLSSLRILYIEGSPELRELPNLPPSLERLEIRKECNPELKERYREHGGSDRHNIAHIPNIRIDE